MQIITVAIQKGGIGKTSIAWSLWHILQQRGYMVLGVDTDSQCNFSFCVNLQEDADLMTLYDVVMNECTIKEAIHPVTMLGHFLPGSIGLASLDKTLPSQTLKDLLTQVENEYDFVIIDSPPNIGTMTTNSLVASNWVVVPVQADIFSATAINAFLDTVAYIPSLRVAGFLLNKFFPRQVLSKELLDLFKQIAFNKGTKVFDTTIRESVTLKKGQANKDFSLVKGVVFDALNHFVDELLDTIGGVTHG